MLSILGRNSRAYYYSLKAAYIYISTYIYISLYICIYVHVCIHAHIRTKHAIAFEIVTMGYNGYEVSKVLDPC